MHGIPHLDEVPFQGLITGSAKVLQDCVDTIKSKYNENSLNPEDVRVRKSWVTWYEKFAPKTDDIGEFVQKSKSLRGVLKNPLGTREAKLHIIWDQSVKVQNYTWEFHKNPTDKINPEFKYPAVLQAAMNSVHTKLNSNPQRPRFTAEQDTKMLEFCTRFDEETDRFYTNNLVIRTVTVLKEMISRLTSYSGLRMSMSGNKDSLITKIRSWNKEFLCTIFRAPLPVHITVIESKFKLSIHTEEEACTPVCRTSDDNAGIVITRNDFRSLSNGNILTAKCVNAFLDLFNRRELRIVSAYRDKYERTDHFLPRKPSLYLGVSFMKDLLSMTTPDSFNVQKYFGDLDTAPPLDSYFRIYCGHSCEGNNREEFSLIVLDFKLKRVEVLNPWWGTDEELCDKRFLSKIFENLKTLSPKFRVDFRSDEWGIRLYPHQYYNPLSFKRDYGSSFHFFILLYFMSIDSPIFFQDDLVEIFRNNLCVWLLNGTFPF